MNVKQRLKQHIKENRWQYILVVMLFLAGLIMGNHGVTGLEGGVKDYLSGLIDDYLKGGLEGRLNGSSIFIGAFITQAKTILALWFLGLTVIGFPLIPALVFMRGYALGFTVGFLIYEKAGAGVLITILSIVPQNLVYIPFLIIWAVMAMNFSAFIVKGRSTGVDSLSKGLVSYSLLMLVCLLIFLMGAFIEAYLSPWFLGLFI
ncbi:stage II sporulation protein M [Syntrophomonas erecta]